MMSFLPTSNPHYVEQKSGGIWKIPSNAEMSLADCHDHKNIELAVGKTSVNVFLV